MIRFWASNKKSVNKPDIHFMIWDWFTKEKIWVSLWLYLNVESSMDQWLICSWIIPDAKSRPAGQGGQGANLPPSPAFILASVVRGKPCSIKRLCITNYTPNFHTLWPSVNNICTLLNDKCIRYLFWLLSASKPKCNFCHWSKMTHMSSSYLLPKFSSEPL